MLSEFESAWWKELDFPSQTHGMYAQVWEYFVTHSSLSIRLYRIKDTFPIPGEYFLYCAACESLPQRTHWRVDKLDVHQVEGDFVIEDRSNGISFRCGSARLYDLRSVLDHCGGGIRREVRIQRGGMTESGELCLFLSHTHKPVSPVISYWIQPIHLAPLSIHATDSMEGYQLGLIEIAKEIDRLRAEGTEIYWKVPGDRCGL